MAMWSISGIPHEGVINVPKVVVLAPSDWLGYPLKVIGSIVVGNEAHYCDVNDFRQERVMTDVRAAGLVLLRQVVWDDFGTGMMAESLRRSDTV